MRTDWFNQTTEQYLASTLPLFLFTKVHFIGQWVHQESSGGTWRTMKINPIVNAPYCQLWSVITWHHVRHISELFLSDACQPEVVFFRFLHGGFAQSFGQIVSIVVKTFRNANLVVSRCFKVEKDLISGWRASLKNAFTKAPFIGVVKQWNGGHISHLSCES